MSSSQSSQSSYFAAYYKNMLSAIDDISGKIRTYADKLSGEDENPPMTPLHFNIFETLRRQQPNRYELILKTCQEAKNASRDEKIQVASKLFL